MAEICRDPRCIICPLPHQIKVNSGDIKMREIKVGQVFYTVDLRDEIACTFYSAKLNKMAMVRNISCEELKTVIQLMNQRNAVEESLIKVCLVGGDGSEKSENYAQQIIMTLNAIDNDTDIIDIVGYDVGRKVHPESFFIDCNGKLGCW